LNLTEWPIALVDDLEQKLLRQGNKLASLENSLDDHTNRQMQKSFVFRGFLEGCKGWNTSGLMLDLPAGVKIERAYHGLKNHQNNGSSKPRPIYAQFL